ncbi:hypothetical protein TWF970_008685 [Orbilia oligospora]|uniref:Nucleoside phosphorylase domain-containing protein n=1 Tax=Orbilia oligospora TaxID=2813651 RepID=A0A7C8VDY3_ORBOL|nr:hypothetical protein TWF970_008685 [Orbilia oligospora]
MQRRRLPSPCPEDFTIGWISAIPAELAAAQAMFDEVYEDLDSIKGIEAIYSYGRIQGHNVVVGPLPDRRYGKISAAIMSTRMEADFPSIKYFLMVGIGGGVPSAGKDIRLGDVVVGMEVVQYDFVKAHPDGNKRIGDLMSPSRTLRTAVASVRAANGRNEFNILKYSAFFEKNPMLNSFPRQRSGTGSLGDIIYEDILYKADYIHAQEEPFFNHSRLRDYNPSTIYMKNVNFGESMTEESGTNKRKRQREDHCGSRGCESKRSKVGQYRGGDCSSESSSEGEDDEESDSDRDGLDGDSDNSERNGFLELYRELYNGESSDDLEEDHMGVDSSDSGEERNSGFDSSEEDDNDDDDM